MRVSQYVRVYYSIVDDERFASVYDTPHLATWLRLLMIADAVWPASAYLPASEKRSSVAVLARAGLLELDGRRFRVHGLDAERNARGNAGRIGAAERWQSGRSANAMQTHSERNANGMPSRAEPSKAEPSTGDRADLEAFLMVRYRPPTKGQRDLLDAYCRAFDETGPDRAAHLILSHPDDPIGAVKADLEAFREERRAAAIAQESPAPARRKGSGMSSLNQELAKLYNDKYAAEGAPSVPKPELVS